MMRGVENAEVDTAICLPVGHPAGFAIAYALNPLSWLMVWAFFQIGKIGCPHCRQEVGGVSVRNAAIGTGLRCTQCGNVFKKLGA